MIRKNVLLLVLDPEEGQALMISGDLIGEKDF
jgi:hypothetical protein